MPTLEHVHVLQSQHSVALNSHSHRNTYTCITPPPTYTILYIYVSTIYPVHKRNTIIWLIDLFEK
jgi:hypothetical protein